MQPRNGLPRSCAVGLILVVEDDDDLRDGVAARSDPDPLWRLLPAQRLRECRGGHRPTRPRRHNRWIGPRASKCDRTNVAVATDRLARRSQKSRRLLPPDLRRHIFRGRTFRRKTHRTKLPVGRRARKCDRTKPVSVADLARMRCANLEIVTAGRMRTAQIDGRSPSRELRHRSACERWPGPLTLRAWHFPTSH